MSISWAAHRTRLLLIICAAVLAVAGVLTLTSQGASARAGGSHAFHWGGGPKPVIVLEHGAWADGSSWDRVIRRLEGAGFTVYAPPNPLRGLPSDSAYLHDFLTQNAALAGHPVVLVGHSYGGAVITNAAVGDPEVKALVFVDAFIPDQGETLGGLLGSVPGSCLAATPPTCSLRALPWRPARRRRHLHQADLVPGCFASGLPAQQPRSSPLRSGHWQPARSASRPAAGLEDHPVVGGHRHRRQGHPTRLAAVHGPARRCPHHRRQRRPPVLDLPRQHRRQGHPASRQRYRLTSSNGQPAGAQRIPLRGPGTGRRRLDVRSPRASG